MKPQRLQLTRRKGFNLQAMSRALNGLPARIVARPGPWGNPFQWQQIAATTGVDRLGAQAIAVGRYRSWISGEGEAPGGMAPPELSLVRHDLAGKNLACWCKPGTPCHAEILLDLANS